MPDFKLEHIFIAMFEISERKEIIMKNTDLFLTVGMAAP